jgi:hypothetical protein
VRQQLMLIFCGIVDHRARLREHRLGCALTLPKQPDPGVLEPCELLNAGLANRIA